MQQGSNQNNPLGARMQGVRTARDGSAGTTGTPNVVNHVVNAEWVVVNYNDERGTAQTALYLKIGDAYYATRDTVTWCAALLPMTDWLKDKVTEHLKDKEPVVIPSSDSVDVLGGGEDDEAE